MSADERQCQEEWERDREIAVRRYHLDSTFHAFVDAVWLAGESGKEDLATALHRLERHVGDERRGAADAEA